MITIDDTVMALFVVIVLLGWVALGVCAGVVVLEWKHRRNDF